MELEHALAAELSRLHVAAAAASKVLADRRPFWVRALCFLGQVVF